LATSVDRAAWAVAVVASLACNIINNLPVGLAAGSVIASADLPERIKAAILIGVDLGPNLSVTGSLATVLWLAALRREGQAVDAWQFLRLGALLTPPAIILSVASLSLAWIF